MYCQFRRATLGMAICKHFHVPKQSAGMEMGILFWASVYFGAAFSTHHAPNKHSHSFNSLSLWCQTPTQRRSEGKLWLFRQLLNGSAKTKWTTDTRLNRWGWSLGSVWMKWARVTLILHNSALCMESGHSRGEIMQRITGSIFFFFYFFFFFVRLLF